MIDEKDLKYDGTRGVPVMKASESARKCQTGLWRTKKPVIDLKKCIKCKACWLYCPEGAVKWTERGPEINYEICKGCLICADNCPVKAIAVVDEK